MSATTAAAGAAMDAAVAATFCSGCCTCCCCNSQYEQVKVTQSGKYLYGPHGKSLGGCIRPCEHTNKGPSARHGQQQQQQHFRQQQNQQLTYQQQQQQHLLLLLMLRKYCCCCWMLLLLSAASTFSSPRSVSNHAWHIAHQRFSHALLGICIHGKSSNPAQNPEIDIGSCNCVPRTRWKLRRAIRQGLCC